MNTNQHGEGRIEGLSTLGELMSKGFEDFWKAWPTSQRKGAKSSCKAKWDKNGFDLQADQIIKHVEWLKTTEQWRKGDGAFIPAPLVYLNQQRWDGAEIPEPPPPPSQFKDEALAKIEADREKATPMPEDIKKRLELLRRSFV